MMTDPRYSISVRWGPRQEPPDKLSARAIETFSSLARLSPLLADWYVGDEQGRSSVLRLDQETITALIRSDIAKDESGEPQSCYGYSFRALNRSDNDWTPRTLRLGLYAGADVPYAKNAAYAETAYALTPDPVLVSYPIFKGALLALAENFSAGIGMAYPDRLVETMPQGRESSQLPRVWISYLGPRYAPLVTPPMGAIVERRAAGGLLMAATTDTFDVDNPRHMAVADKIFSAVAPFNALGLPTSADG